MNKVIEHTGIINHIEGIHIQVLIIQQSACSACHAKEACISSDQDEKIIEVDCSDPAFKVGQSVTVYGQRSMGLQAVLLVFVLPFILILITLLVLSSFVFNEALSGILALIVLIPYYIILSLFNKQLKSKFQFYIKKEPAD